MGYLLSRGHQIALKYRCSCHLPSHFHQDAYDKHLINNIRLAFCLLLRSLKATCSSASIPFATETLDCTEEFCSCVNILTTLPSRRFQQSLIKTYLTRHFKQTRTLFTFRLPLLRCSKSSMPSSAGIPFTTRTPDFTGASLPVSWTFSWSSSSVGHTTGMIADARSRATPPNSYQFKKKSTGHDSVGDHCIALRDVLRYTSRSINFAG